MKISAISFGKVIAVSGKEKKIKKVNRVIQPYANSGKIMIKDVTRNYINARSSGVLASAAQQGDRVNIYITGEDVKKVRDNDEQWNTTEKILSNLCKYYDVNKMSVSETARTIIKG